MIDPGVSMDDTEDKEPPRRKEHRRVPSTIAFEEVKVGSTTLLCHFTVSLLSTSIIDLDSVSQLTKRFIHGLE